MAESPPQGKGVARQVARNAGALTAARGVTAVLTFVTTIHVAQVLNPDGYGVLNWSLAVLAYFGIGADLGLGVYAVREISRGTVDVRRIAGEVIALRLGFALGAFLLYLGAIALLGGEQRYLAPAVVLGIGLFANALELGWVYHGLQRLGVVAVRNVLVSVVTLVGMFVFVREAHHVVIAAAVMVSASLLATGWLFITYSREFGRPRFGVRRSVGVAMLAAAFPIAASQFLNIVNTSLDQVLLGVLRTDVEVGWYAAAYRVLTAALIPSQVAFYAFLPALAAVIGQADAMRERATMLARALFLLGIPAAVGGILLAPDIVLVFGTAYAPAGGVLAILMGSLLMTYARDVYGGALLAWDRQRTYMIALAGGAVLNLALNLVLIPRYGVFGAAAATVTSEALIVVATAALYRQITGTVHAGLVVRVIVAAGLGVAAPILFVRYLGGSFWIAAAVAVAGYALVVCAMRLVSLDLLTQLRRVRAN